MTFLKGHVHAHQDHPAARPRPAPAPDPLPTVPTLGGPTEVEHRPLSLNCRCPGCTADRNASTVDLDALQAMACEWSARELPATHNIDAKLHKLSEEVGEVCGAHVKEQEGRVAEQAFWDEMGDVGFVMMVTCEMRGRSFSEVIAERAPSVLARRFATAGQVD